MTIREAAEKWVREFSRIPYDVVKKLMEYSQFADITEITPIAIGDQVYIYNGKHEDKYGEVVSRSKASDSAYNVRLEDGKRVRIEDSDMEVQRDGCLPMWGTLWAFGDSCDDYWLEELGGLQKMADCGFRIYESEDYGYIFGIDGCGYDFYESHWVPLYKARGLKWHDMEETCA